MDNQSPASQPQPKFQSFAEFYPYYLQEHSNLTCRRLHFVGTALVITLLITALISGNLMLLWTLPVAGYGFAWVGHFFFEHNRPATFKNPFYSLWGDFVMFKDILTGNIAR
ncbi:Mpo1-like protein [Microbulbifer sp. SA54]|uniref:Mpo1-like protein n=1 Tax=Microbulbifer sp. SA54 TaxID=3401577 RepID=UPI003AAFCB6C